MDLHQISDGSAELYSDLEGFGCGRAGGPKTPTAGASGKGSAKYRLSTVAVIPLALASGNGGLAAWQPDNTGIDYIVTKVEVDITTAQSGQTVSIGTAANATTSSSNLISAGSLASTGVLNSTASEHFAVGSSGQWLTATASGTPTTLAGNLYVTFYPA